MKFLLIRSLFWYEETAKDVVPTKKEDFSSKLYELIEQLV